MPRCTWGTMAAVMLIAGSAAAAPISTTDPYTSDLWQAPASVTSSALYNGGEGISDARDIFGGEYSTVERGRTLFADDDYPAGTVHWVRWTTASPITFNSFSLLATGDIVPSRGRPFYYLWRSINHFVLKRGDGQMIYETDITQPVGDWVELWVTLSSPVTEQEFLAEFTQGWGEFPSGPRIAELDAFFYVPEPGTLTLIGLGIAALIWTRRSKAK